MDSTIDINNQQYFTKEILTFCVIICLESMIFERKGKSQLPVQIQNLVIYGPTKIYKYFFLLPNPSGKYL